MTRHQTPLSRAGKPSGLPFLAQLVDVASKSHLTHPTIYGSGDHYRYIVEAIGCGCAFIDYDNDGWMDLFVLCGTRFDAPSDPEATNRLYRNNRDGTFTDVTRAAGLLRTGWACGVTVGDYNNDGNEDLFITYWGQNVLYRNNGDGTFTDVTAAAGLGSDKVRWGTGCAFVDTMRSGWLDLFVSNYIEFDVALASLPGAKSNCIFDGVAVNCGPRGFPAGHNSLYRNNGDGTFTDISEQAGIASHSIASYGLTVGVADFDNDGWPDLYVACDSTPSLFYHNQRNGTFVEEGILRGVAYSDDGQEQAGMGTAFGDYNLDGFLDIFKTNFSGDVPNLYRNKNGLFEDVARQAGVAVDNRFVCWGAGMVDFENKGYPDLLMVGGHVYPELNKLLPSEPSKAPRILFRALGGGRFEELSNQAGAALESLHSSRGCAFGDFDNDGDVDVLIVNLNEPPTLLRNDLSGNHHWLKVKLIGTASNRSAIGSRVTVKTSISTQIQELQSQSSFLSCNDPRLHFGLGNQTEVQLRVRWPSGVWQSVPVPGVNRLVTIKEGSGIVPNRGAAPDKA